MFNAIVDISRRQALKPLLPHLYRSKKYNQIVLFLDEHEGIVLDQGTSKHCAGQHELDFISCYDISVWIPFAPGESITLTAE
jgi:hypothetical protein